MNNLISNQNDGTFQNVETPIGQAVSLFGQAIDQTKENINNQVKFDENFDKILHEVGPVEAIDYYKSEKEKEKQAVLDEVYGNTEDTTLQDTLKWAEEQQAKEWAREDEIRKETQAREDSALQRWVADAQRAGINPNLFSGQGAASGGGITSATGLNMSQYETVANRLLTEWETMVNQEFEKNENKKDRFNNIMRGLLNLAGLGIFASKKK